MDDIQERRMEPAVEKPFRMLSAYLMTDATSRPPSDCSITTVHTSPV